MFVQIIRAQEQVKVIVAIANNRNIRMKKIRF